MCEMSANAKSTVSRCRIAATIFLLVAFAPLGHAAEYGADRYAVARAEFVPQYTALVAGLPVLDGTDSEALQSYPLYNWLRAARLKRDLAIASTDTSLRTTDFLAQYGAAPFTHELRRAWLRKLATHADSKTFLTEYRSDVADDALRCQQLNARIAVGDTKGLAETLAERWASEPDMPTECAPAIAWLQQQPAFTAALVQRRVRARLLDGDSTRASLLVARLGTSAREHALAWLRLLDAPAAEFGKLAAGTAKAPEDEVLLDTWTRSARRAPKEAAVLLSSLLEQLQPDATLTRALTNAVALGLSWNRDGQALSLFRIAAQAGPPPASDDRTYEWRIRAALWAGDWSQALLWLQALPPRLAAQARWRYWRARALEELDQGDAARPLYQALVGELDGYGLLASWRLGQTYTPPDQPTMFAPSARAALEAQPAYGRAQEAWRAGQKSIASLEWRDAYDQLDATDRPVMVGVAKEWGWYDQAIVTATRLQIFGDIEALFPRPFAPQVKEAVALSGTPAPWLYGVMRKESVFKPDAVSSAGAIGLLQLLPGTAQLVAKRFLRPKPSRDALFDPAVNLPLGALHLRELADQYNGRWMLALAAYNAGPRAAQRWLPTDGPRDADVWMENIPFNETRGYVQRILLHVAVYQFLETGKPVRANNWLPPLLPAP